ncbi:MAG: multicopper oxidase domain-containing protein [Actinomycetota bacterium]
MRRRHRTVLALTLALSLVAVGCTGEGAPAAGGEGDGAAGEATAVEITLTDFAIDPVMPEVPAGVPVVFNVTNAGQAPHTFGIVVGEQTYETPMLNPDESAVLETPALAAGDFETLCTVAGHADLGMVGMVHAVEGAGTGSGTASPAPPATMTAEEMAAGHEEGVLAFAGQLEDGPLTPDHGGQPLEPTMDAGVKVFDLVTSEIAWEIAPGETVDAMAINGQVPGPEMRVQPGDSVRFNVENQMSQPFTLHFHGVTLPNDQDGVPYITQPPIMPGESWTYEFKIVDPPGFYVYHSHFNSTEQVDRGLYGALIVEPKGGAWESVYGVEPDVETTMFIGDGALGYNLNGKSFPATLPVIAEQGQDVLFHIANEGQLLHPMHLHGFHFEVVGIDGYPLQADDRYLLDTLVVAPGARYDFIVRADQPGIWAFHCHILPHVEGPGGMFGMVSALIVQ